MSGAPTPTWLAEQRLLMAGLVRSAVRPEGGFGWLDDRGVLTPGRPVELWITTRMTHVAALASLHDGLDTGDVVEHGLASLRGLLHDETNGGWFAAVGPAGPTGPHGRTKRAYEHAFVLLAASSARAAGHDATDILDEVLDLLEQRFYDPDVGWYVDVLTEDLQEAEPYLGANATMHLVEALLTAHDVGVGTWALDRALELATRVIHDVAAVRGFRLPEHFDRTGEAMPDYHRDLPDDPFRPYGVTIGHLLEWARLLVHLRHALGDDAPAWLLEDAEALFARAVADGWAVDGTDGFVYTTGFDGVPIVRQRLHWVLAEALGAAECLATVTGRERYGEWRARWWQHARHDVIDIDGSWRHELDPALTPTATIWSGRPDVYHGYQAALLPALGTVSSFVSRRY